MRRCKTVTWILILSIVNFALGAPTAVRERLEMSVDVDVVEGGTATSQKRYDPLDDWSTTNSADRPPTPPRLTPAEIDQLWKDVEEYRIDRYSPLTPESPGSTESVDSSWSPIAYTDSRHSPPPSWEPLDWGGSPNVLGLNHAPPSSPDLTGILKQMEEQMAEQQRHIDGPPPLPIGSYPGPTGGSHLPPLPLPGPPRDRFPSPPGFPVNPDAFSSIDHQPTTPQSPTGGSPLPHPGPSEGRFQSPPGWSNPDTLSTGHQPTPPQNPTGGSSLPPLPDPGPSEGRFPSPPGWSVNPDTLSSTGHQPMPPQSPTGLPHPGSSEDRSPTPHCWLASCNALSSIGSQATPPQSPARDPVTRLPPSLEPSPDEFLDMLLKGKIKRRIYGSGTARRDLRFWNFPRRRRDAGT